MTRFNNSLLLLLFIKRRREPFSIESIRQTTTTNGQTITHSDNIYKLSHPFLLRCVLRRLFIYALEKYQSSSTTKCCYDGSLSHDNIRRHCVLHHHRLFTWAKQDIQKRRRLEKVSFHTHIAISSRINI